MSWIKFSFGKSGNSSAESRHASEYTDTLFGLYLWLVVIVLCGLGNIGYLSHVNISSFIMLGVSFLTSMVFLVIFFRGNSSAIGLLSFFAYALLVIMPVCIFAPKAEQRIIFLDLYFILLVAVPALLRFWPWAVQGIAAALVVVANVRMWWTYDRGWGFGLSLLLIVTTAFLSVLVAYTFSDETRSKRLKKERENFRMFVERASEALSDRVWSIVLLQVGLLVVLLFLDSGIWGYALSFPVLCKVYGLIVLILTSLVLAVAKPCYISAIIAVATVFVGVALSFSLKEFAETYVVYSAFPIVYLAFVTSGLPWGLEKQVAVAWALLVGDLAVKVSKPFEEISSLNLAVFQSIESYRGELCLVTFGTALSVLVARLIRKYQSANMPELWSGDDESLGAIVKERRVLEPQAPVSGRLPFSFHNSAVPDRMHRLELGLLVTGILACVLSSKLLLMLDANLWGVAVTVWGVVFIAWALLLYLERNDYPQEQLWFFGAFVALILLLGLSVLLIFVDNARPLWGFWPLCLFIAIGSIPWGIRDLIPLIAVNAVVGAEIIYRLNLGLWGTSVFVIVIVVSAWCSRNDLWRSVERFLLTNTHRPLSQTSDQTEVIRLLADCLMRLFSFRSSIVSLERGHLELIRDGRYYQISKEDRSIRSLLEGETQLEPGEVGIRSVDWLPGSIHLFDKRFGELSVSSGVIVEIRSEQAAFGSVNEESLVDFDPILIFLSSALPLSGLFSRGRWMAAKALVRLAQLRLSAFREEQKRLRYEEHSDHLRSEREYELSVLVHDINNTVQDLTLLCDVILEDMLPEENIRGTRREKDPKRREALRKEIERIALIARSVATIVSDAKRKRELERLQDLTPRELVGVSSVIREIISFATLRAERKRIEVRPPVLPDEELWVRISVREHLETILRNLLNNAIMYSSRNTVVRVDVRYNDGWVWIDVIDTGPGLSTEECDSIFLSGVRGKASRGNEGGLGVGLAQSRRVAESAGGSLTVSSRGSGFGSTFTVKLPRQKAPQVKLPRSPWALMVDDQPALVDFYSRMAKAIELEPGLAGSVSDAIALIKEKGPPAFVLTDVHLGDSDGLELVRYIRRDYGKNVPILVVSGVSDADIAQKARVAGASDFVAKPIGRRALFARIQSLLQV